MTTNISENYKYIYHLPFLERSKLCKILNQNDKWEELAGIWMKFNILTIQDLRKEKNPTDELLTLWGQQNHTIVELFVLLSRMQHYQSMVPLLPFVDQKFHQLLYKGEGNLQSILCGQQPDRNTKDLKIGAQNFNQCILPQPNIPKVITQENEHHKILNQPIGQLSNNRSNYNNLIVISPAAIVAPDHPLQNTEGNNKKMNELQQPKVVIQEDAHHKILNQPKGQLPTNQSNSNNLIVASPIEIKASAHLLQNTSSNNKKINDLPLPRTEATLPHATYSELGIATNGWNKYNILGKGGFGTVYRGTWKNTDVAIKKIERKERHGLDEGYIVQLQQSLTEIKILNSHPHENILSLYAYSFGGDSPCLVYQLMRNGSLEDRLLIRQKTKPLTWLQRHEIAKGTARGLQYLHTIGEKPLIHGDIKSANILLDKNFEPKIGDFGLAREGPERESMKISKINGTRPYLPEDFLINRKLSTKIDTYSYGIVLFEIATGLLAYDKMRPENKYLRDIIDTWEDKDLHLLMDKKTGEKDSQVYGNLIVLGKWCSNRLAQNRPEMEIVFRKLNDL